MEQHGAYVVTGERDTPCQRFEQHNAGGIQVGGRANLAIQRTVVFGRTIQRRPQRFLFTQDLKRHGSRQVIIDENDLFQRRFFLDDDVGRLNVAVQHVALMSLFQRSENTYTCRQGILHSQRSSAQVRLQSDSWNERPNQVETALVVADQLRWSQQPALRFAQYRCFALQLRWNMVGDDLP